MQQNQGICKIATGELYSNEYPLIFSHAQTTVSNQNICLTLEPSAHERIDYVKNSVLSSATSLVREHPYMIVGGGILGGTLAVTNFYWTAAASAIALTSATVFMFYKQYRYTSIPSVPHQSLKTITYSQADDALVKEILSKPNPEGVPLVDNLDRAFRNYRLNVLSAKQLNRKISTLIEQHKNSDSLAKIPILSQMEELFASGEKVREKIHGKTLVAFIGQTGSGKTTSGNYLCGCKMRAVKAAFLRKPALRNDEIVIIAEKCIGDIGHKVGSNSSETFDPQLFTDEEHGITYCDCPGLGDNREKAIALCNSLSIVDIIKNAASVQGFIFFIEYTDLMVNRGANVKQDMKVLQLLLGDFEPYKNSLLFVITKSMPGAEVKSIRVYLKALLKTIFEDEKSEDEKLKNFCKGIVESNVLADRLVMCDPLSNEQVKQSMIQKIKNLHSFDPKKYEFHHPL